MGLKIAGALFVLVLAASMVASATAKRGWNWNNWNSSTTAGNWNHTNNQNFWGFWHKNATATQRSNRIIVGGSENWHFGYNYTDWAIKNGPFYMNDTLGTQS